MSLSGRLPSILIFGYLGLVTRFVTMLLHESFSNNSCYFIGLLCRVREQSNLFWQFRSLIRKYLILSHFIGLGTSLSLHR